MGACPPVVEYSREFQAWAAEELALLPEGSAAADLLADYAVTREQVRTCQEPGAIDGSRRGKGARDRRPDQND